MKKLFLVLICLLPLALLGQTTSEKSSIEVSLKWNIDVPVGDFTKFIPTTSGSGGSFSFDYIFKNGLGLGFNMDIKSFFDKKDQLTYIDTVKGFALTASHIRFATAVPFSANLSYYFHKENMVVPYIQLGLGANYMAQHLIVQDYDFYATNWGFLVSPAMGVNVAFGKTSPVGAKVSVGYNYNTNKFAMGNKEFNDFQSLSIKAGLFLKFD